MKVRYVAFWFLITDEKSFEYFVRAVVLRRFVLIVIIISLILFSGSDAPSVSVEQAFLCILFVVSAG
jgi:hypothetical protein